MRAVLLSAALLTIAGAACAADPRPIERRFTPAQLREAGLDTLSPAQLAALNRLLREEATATVANASAPDATGSTAAAPVAAPVAPDPVRDAGLMEGASDGPIKSRLVGRVEGWSPGTVFELDNGQQWRVLKGAMTLRTPLERPQIEVVPGVSGRWFLQVDPDLPKARVQRIR